MPASPKSPQTKKQGAPKQKGAVRAKSGCYTCRIRRKKCDEQQNQDGRCETCVRLHLQCLGFGAKRPEWLREGRNVSETRDKIKAFLAAQGMIKGHSGAAQRGSEYDSPILRLEEDNTPSSSESPPTPTLSLSPSEPSRPLHHESAIRDQRGWMGVSYSHGLHNPHMRGVSPFEGSSHSSHPDMYQTSYNSSPSLPWMQQHQNGIPRLIEPAPRNQSQAVAVRFPAIHSSFSDTYHTNYDDADMYYMGQLDEEIAPQEAAFNFYVAPSSKRNNSTNAMDELVTHYVGSVMDRQYLLADRTHIHSILLPSVMNDSESRRAARLLAGIHAKRATYRSHSFVALQDKETKSLYEELQQVLHKKEPHTEDDALAAISIISSFLFDGGAGAWQAWLKVSYNYACTVFSQRDPHDALLTCNETTRFIIKVAIWFDVLAALTTQEQPRFLRFIRALYSPEASAIYDPSLPPSPELSMKSVMGCENHIVWALAEAADLAVWKRAQQTAGTLSVPELVARARNLDNYLDAAPATPALPSVYAPSQKTETEIARELSNNIFRAATRVYVRSIVSGDFPHVPEIVEAVDETMGYVRAPGEHSQNVHSSVVRSTVFASFICGALTDNTRIRHEVIERLNLTGEDPSLSAVGNSTSIRNLLEKLELHQVVSAFTDVGR
ncbi:fungal-specific transcription factor domain-containing protein [Mycena olivaceomarginata]|nr:fungal-specific transcription factor domain-containing protein [Mycena olivaceomarginata]